MPAGLLKEVDHEITEIDVSKAFTSAFSQITEIPIFNEFDCFQLYNNDPIAASISICIYCSSLWLNEGYGA